MDLIPELPQLPNRPAEGHKGTFGKVLLVAGSPGMSGAAALSGLGALRGGSGLVFLAVPRSIQAIVAGIDPSYLTVGLPDDGDGHIAAPALPILHERITSCDAAALGPGLGQTDILAEIVTDLYRNVTGPLVVDADGLNILARDPQRLADHAGPRVLTPHPGEFSRLSGHTIAAIEADREQSAADFARRYGLVVVLKGPRTIITDGEHLAVNQTGNSGLGTGGSGDVLTGVITSLLGQGMPPLAAAQLATHLHGLAGDLAAQDLSQPGLIASDLPHYLARAWKQLGNR